MLPHERQHLLRIIAAKTGTPAAPKAIGRRAVNRTDLAPIIKILAVLSKQRQKYFVKFVKFKQTRQVIPGNALF